MPYNVESAAETVDPLSLTKTALTVLSATTNPSTSPSSSRTNFSKMFRRPYKFGFDAAQAQGRQDSMSSESSCIYERDHEAVKETHETKGMTEEQLGKRAGPSAASGVRSNRVNEGAGPSSMKGRRKKKTGSSKVKKAGKKKKKKKKAGSARALQIGKNSMTARASTNDTQAGSVREARGVTEFGGSASRGVGNVFEGMGGGVGGDGKALLPRWSLKEDPISGKFDMSNLPMQWGVTESRSAYEQNVHPLSRLGGGPGEPMSQSFDEPEISNSRSEVRDIAVDSIKTVESDDDGEGSDPRRYEGAGEEIVHSTDSDDELDEMIEKKIRVRRQIAQRVQEVFGSQSSRTGSRDLAELKEDEERELIRQGYEITEIESNRSFRLTPEQADAIRNSVARTSFEISSIKDDESTSSIPEGPIPNIAVEERNDMPKWKIPHLPKGTLAQAGFAGRQSRSPGRLSSENVRLPSFSGFGRQVSDMSFDVPSRRVSSAYITDDESQGEPEAVAGPSNVHRNRWNLSRRDPRPHPMMLKLQKMYGARAASFDIDVIRRHNKMTIPLSQTHDPFKSIRNKKGPRSNNSYSIDIKCADQYVDLEPKTLADPSADYETSLRFRMNMRSTGGYMGRIEDMSDEEDCNGLLKPGHTRSRDHFQSDCTSSLAARLSQCAVSRRTMRSQGFGCALSLERELLKVLPTSVRHVHYLFIHRPLAELWTSALPRFLACPTVDLGRGIGPELRNLVLYSSCVGPLPRGVRQLTPKEAAAVEFSRMCSAYPHEITQHGRSTMIELFEPDKLEQISFVIAIGGFWVTTMGLFGLDSNDLDPEAMRKARDSINAVGATVEGASKHLSKRKKGLLHRLKIPVRKLSYFRRLAKLESSWLATYPKRWEDMEEQVRMIMGFCPEYVMKIKNPDQRRALCCVLEQILLHEDRTLDVLLPLKHMMMYVLAVAAENHTLSAQSAYLAMRFGATIDQLIRCTNRKLIFRLFKRKAAFEEGKANGISEVPSDTSLQALNLFTQQELAGLMLAHSAATTGRRSSLPKSRDNIHAVGRMHMSSTVTDALCASFIPEGIIEAVAVVGGFSILQRLTSIYRYKSGHLEKKVRQFVQGPAGFELSLSGVGQRKPSRMDSDFGSPSMSSSRLASFLPRRMLTD